MTDESRPSWRRKIGIKYYIADGKQLEAGDDGGLGGAAALTFPPLFRAYPPPPFPFPIPQTTMADAAEHEEELVDYDEEEVG